MSTNEQQLPARRRHLVRRISIIAAIILLLIGTGIFASDEVSQAMHDQQTQAALQSKPVTNVTKVTIVNYEFQPVNIQVKVGTTVTWINQDNVAHTVTFRNGMKDSGLIQQNETFSYTFIRTGTFAYYCDVHSEMIAQVIVIE